ncbi:protein FAM149A-like isoform X5 [Bolinopsis microptera]|uniref:protein FAM149A-like isoform X5 n=1 Tax=Bolinopsis microptera TaxID=2820187 RepID=UPI00307A8890
MARHRGFLEVRGVSRESSTTLTQDNAPWGMNTPMGFCPLSTLSSHHSLLSSNREYESTEGLHSSGISSADSWAQDDEFDRNATRKVRSMFEELETAMFENKNCISRNLEREISEWTEMFPHYRILGKQLCLPTENGTEFISTDSDLSKQELDALLDRSLTLHQQHHSDVAEQCSLSALVLAGTKIKQFEKPPVEEEIFASEGNNEEYLAYDKPDSFSSVAQVYYKYHQKPGFPPITPKSHRKHTIHSLVFVCLWSDCMNASEPLIAKICTGMLPDILSRRSLTRPSLLPPSPLHTGSSSRGLQDVMTIRRVPLQERSSSQQTIYRDMSSQVGRPQSSRLPTVKSVSGLGSLLPLRQKSREHLLPPVDRTKILTFQSPIFNASSASENISSAGLRGRQLRQQPRRLPPLTSDYEPSEHFNPRSVGRNGESRAASAQPEDVSRRNVRTFYSTDGRPNTTSTFRVQTALTRRPPSTSMTRKYQSMAPIGLEIFGASTGTTVSSKGSRLAVVDTDNRLVVDGDYQEHGTSPTKTPTITENVFTKPGRVWITGVQDSADTILYDKSVYLDNRLWRSR